MMVFAASVRPADQDDTRVLTELGIPQSASDIVVCGRPAVAAAAVEDQPFETACLGLHTRRLSRLAARSGAEATLSGLASAVVDAARRDGVALLSCRVPERDREALAALHAAGFAVMECLLTLEAPLAGAGGPEDVAIAGAEDAAEVARLAEGAFHSDRFHTDPRIPTAAADALKAAWAANACRGRADRVFIIRQEGEVLGFNACLRRASTAVIDLIAVAPQARGRGFGGRLVRAAQSHYAGRCSMLRVGTQAGNGASLRLYQAQGMRVVDAALTFHLHLTDGP